MTSSHLGTGKKVNKKQLRTLIRYRNLRVNLVLVDREETRFVYVVLG